MQQFAADKMELKLRINDLINDLRYSINTNPNKNILLIEDLT